MELDFEEPAAESWPAHQRLLAATARGLGASAGFTPLGALLAAGFPVRDFSLFVSFEVVATLFFVAAFVVEQRSDSSIFRLFLRLEGMGLVFGSTLPLVLTWLANPLGSAEAQVSALASWLEEDLAHYMSLSITGALVLYAFLMIPFAMRAHSEELRPQLLAWVGLTSFIGFSGGLAPLEKGEVGEALLFCAVFILCGLLTAGFVHLADRRLLAWGVAGPTP